MAGELSEVLAALESVAAGAAPRALESETLEFKSQGRSERDALQVIAEAVACLANARGGLVVVGLGDREPGLAAFEGCSVEIGVVQRRVFELTDPPLVVPVEELVTHGRRLIVITVPASPHVHQVQGRATERLGTACEPMSSARIAQVIAERRGDDWSAVDSTLGVGAASARSLEEARRLLRQLSDPPRRAWANETDIDLLRRLGLITATGTLNQAGQLLFVGRDGNAHELLYVFRRSSAGELVVNEPLRGPMLSAVLRVLEMIEARVDRTPVNLPGGQQLLVADLPDAAVREALINGVMHRDYRSPDPLHIEHSPERLAVTSPGPFVRGVTVDNVLTTSPRARSPLLANAIRGLGLAEAAGVGVDRMYAEMTRIGHQPPVFTADSHQVRVVLIGGAPNAHVTRYMASLPASRSVDPDTPLVLLNLLTRKTVTAGGLAPLLQRSENEAAGVLEGLCAEPVRMIERTRETARSTRGVYRLREDVVTTLGPAVTYRRRTQDESDRKIIGLVRETGVVNGRMVRLVLDIPAAASSRLLADLVERQILVKTSDAQRGPSVTYGPGPAFAAASPNQARRTSKRHDA